MTRSESLKLFLAGIESGRANLTAWLDRELGEDSNITMTDRSSQVMGEVNESGDVRFEPLVELSGAYGGEFYSELVLVRIADAPGFVCRQAGWKSTSVWGDWEVVATISDPSDPRAMGDAFVGLCGDKGEIVMSYIPSQIVNYQPSLLLRADVRRGLVRQALYSDYWGLTRTGDGIAADAYDVASDESDESRRQRKTLTDERVPRAASFAELSQRQQTAVVDVLMHFAYSTEGEQNL